MLYFNDEELEIIRQWKIKPRVQTSMAITRFMNMNFASSVEDVLNHVDFDKVKVPAAFKRDFEALLESDTFKALGAEVVDEYRLHLKRVFAFYEAQQLYERHTYSEEEERAQSRRAAGLKAAATRKARAKPAAKNKTAKKVTIVEPSAEPSSSLV